MKIFKKIDWYIIRGFLVTFFFSLTLLMAISVVFDISEKLDDFLESNPSTSEIIFDYYVNFIISYGVLFSPLIIFVALIFFTSRMAQRTEVVAILSSGVSFNRYLRPFLIAATILAGGALYVNHFVNPHANKQRLDFEAVYYRNPYKYTESDIHIKMKDDLIVYMKSIDVQKKSATQFSLEKWNQDTLVSKLDARTAKWDTVSNMWSLKNYTHRIFQKDREDFTVGRQLDTVLNSVDISSLGRRIEYVSSMDYYQLDAFIEEEKAKGSTRVPFYLIEKHQRTSYPFATYVLTLIGVSLASRKLRGGIGVQLALGFAIVLIYVFAMKVTTVSATNAGLSPLLAVWIPNIIFLGLALYLYKKAPK